MVTRAFIEAMIEARRRFTAEQWSRLVAGIAGYSDETGELDIGPLLPDVPSSDAVWLLNRGLRLRGGCSWAQVATVLAEFSGMLLFQVLYDLVAQANRRILIVTFAAYRVGHLCELLADAVKRGARLTLVLEGEDASGGQLSHDALNAFGGLRDSGCAIYCWPLEKRERNAAGRPGKLHAKCAVVDDTALVGSGNLTDDAFNRNMELGLVA